MAVRSSMPCWYARFWSESEPESRVPGSGPTKGTPVLSVARQRGSSSGLGAVTQCMHRFG
eukprot:363169-Chlamydomonas_euryale.AAC.15